MKKWNSMKFETLGNIVLIKKGRKPDIIDIPEIGSVRVLQIDDLRNDKNLKYTNDKSGVFATEDDVLIAWDGANAGTIGYGKTGYIGSTIALLRKIDPEKYSTSFIGKFLQSKFETLRSKTTGATIPHIDRKTLDSLKIPQIGILQQLHIANILTQAENLITQRKESIRLLDEFLKSTFLEMFICNDDFKNWTFTEIKNAAEKTKHSIKAGPFGSSLKKEFYVLSGYKIYGQEQVIKDDLNFGDYYINEQLYKTLESCKIKEGDVLISLVGTYGKLSIVPKDFEPGIINPRLMKISFDKRIINSTYFKHLFKSTYLSQQLSKLSRGGTMDIINVGIVKEIKIPIPPIALQAQFAHIVEKTEVLKAQYQQSLQELESLYGSLNQRAFKGELTAKDGEMMMAAEPEVKYMKWRIKYL